MGRLFGTDGVRGVAGRELTAGFAMSLAAAAASVLAESAGAAGAGSVGARSTGARPTAVVGRDPRVSGEFLEAAVVAGLAASGVDVVRLGVIPTPAVAYLTAALGAEFGVVLSASHNPAPDNGIKFFARGGRKLPDEVEDKIEARLATAGMRGSGGSSPRVSTAGGSGGSSPRANTAGSDGFGPVGVPASGFGRVRDADDQAERYLSHLLSTVPGRSAGAGKSRSPLSGLRVVVDCAHGAASRFAPELLRRAGAEVIPIGAEPDGLNINAGCGSTSLNALGAAVTEHRADAGIAHDGDADRCLAVDAAGRVVDGDQILAVLALELKAAERLTGNTVVTTVMSNLGFRHAMREAGIEVIETPVGDRHLLTAMLAGRFVLGGEQSGHIIMLEHATTGDGLLTGLHLLAAMTRGGRPLAEVASVMTRFPQVLINIPGVDKSRAVSSRLLIAAVAAAEAELGDSGRVLVRPSGTEPAVRVMVEAVDSGQAQRLAGELAAVVREAG